MTSPLNPFPREHYEPVSFSGKMEHLHRLYCERFGDFKGEMGREIIGYRIGYGGINDLCQIVENTDIQDIRNLISSVYPICSTNDKQLKGGNE